MQISSLDSIGSAYGTREHSILQELVTEYQMYPGLQLHVYLLALPVEYLTKEQLIQQEDELEFQYQRLQQ